jgi:hypothetical protein
MLLLKKNQNNRFSLTRNEGAFVDKYAYTSTVECGKKFSPKNLYDELSLSNLTPGLAYT